MIDYKLLKRILATPIISDVFDEAGINGMLSSAFSPNYENAKIFGKAKTILVEKREEGEPVNGIYNGLKIFSTVNEDDVIIIKNELNHLAYWGELNTMLALRARASGTIVDGVTRDNKQTKLLEYPVFSKGKYAKDIKNHGTINKINCSLIIDGITIEPDDLIFGDIDGIAIIPKDKEEWVLKRSLEISYGEKSIINDIIKGVEPNKLIEKYGFF